MFGVHRILLLIPSNRRSNFFFFCSTKDKSSGSNSNNGSVINANTVFIPQDLVHQESSGQAWGHHEEYKPILLVCYASH